MNPQTFSTRDNSKNFAQPSAPQSTGRPAKDNNNNNSPAATKSSAKAKSGSTASAFNPQPQRPVAGDHTFRFEALNAKDVLLVGDFSDWENRPVKMIKGGGGVWHAQVPLPPGRHSYRFLVDGTWQDDPKCQEKIPNNFGSYNNVINIA